MNMPFPRCWKITECRKSWCPVLLLESSGPAAFQGADICCLEEKNPCIYCMSSSTLSRAQGSTCNQTHKYSHYMDNLASDKVTFLQQSEFTSGQVLLLIKLRKKFPFLSSFGIADRNCEPVVFAREIPSSLSGAFFKAKQGGPVDAHLGRQGDGYTASSQRPWIVANTPLTAPSWLGELRALVTHCPSMCTHLP